MPDDNEPQDPYRQNPGGQDPYGQDPYGQSGGNQNPYGQNPYGQPGQNPYGQNPYDQAPSGQAPYSQQPQHAPFSATDSVGWGWRFFTRSWGPMLGLGALTVIAPATMSWNSVGGDSDLLRITFAPVGFALAVLGSLVTFVLMVAVSKGAVDAARTGAKVTFSSCFDGLNWSTVLLAGLAYAVVVEVANLFLLLPGLVAMFLLMFLPVASVLAPGAEVGVTLKSAVTAVTDNFGSALVLGLLALGVAVLGFLACCVGAFVAIPVAVAALAHGYLRLTGQPVHQL